ncbi:AHH domain-containing protein, partial [Micromonospora phytophila]|uniref:AHH domain-containing protein n=1 Tax=Micromonospora phytophila TaxID=709888 RepID=UPI00202FD01B
REGAEEAGERAVAQPADELGEGAVRAADEPGVPTLRDDALKAAEFPLAMAEARTIETVNDVVDSPLPVLMASLMVLKRRYRWIDTFTATPVGPGVYDIELVASPGTLVGRFDNEGGPGGGRPPGPRGPHADEIDRLMTEADGLGQRISREELERAAAANPEGFPALAAEVREELNDRAARAASRGSPVAESTALLDEAEAPTIRGVGDEAESGLTPRDEGWNEAGNPDLDAPDFRDPTTSSISASEALGQALGPPPGPGYHAHHVIPTSEGGEGLDWLRQRATEAGVAANGADNGVWLIGTRSGANLDAGIPHTTYLHAGNREDYLFTLSERLQDLHGPAFRQEMAAIRRELSEGSFEFLEAPAGWLDSLVD